MLYQFLTKLYTCVSVLNKKCFMLVQLSLEMCMFRVCFLVKCFNFSTRSQPLGWLYLPQMEPTRQKPSRWVRVTQVKPRLRRFPQVYRTQRLGSGGQFGAICTKSVYFCAFFETKMNQKRALCDLFVQFYFILYSCQSDLANIQLKRGIMAYMTINYM